MNTINFIALRAISTPVKALKGLKIMQKIKPENTFKVHCKSLALIGAAVLLAACATPTPPASKAVYDFGPVQSTANTPVSASAPRHPAIALPEIEAGAGLDSPALLYRLQYQDAQQLRPYAQARWSVPPAQLVRARLRDALAALGPVLPLEGSAALALRIELDEFSHIFSSQDASQGLVRIHASLLKNEQLIAQTTLLARANAPSQDAAGGVRALTIATDDVVKQVAAWVSGQVVGK
jgi:cholesterol transport system auxiliary component